MGFRRIRFPCPNIGGDTAKLIDELKRTLGIIEGCFDFSTMADNAFILKKTDDIIVAKIGNFVKIKSLKRFSKIVTLPKDGQPGESRLESLKTNFLKKPKIL